MLQHCRRKMAELVPPPWNIRMRGKWSVQDSSHFSARKVISLTVFRLYHGLTVYKLELDFSRCLDADCKIDVWVRSFSVHGVM